MSNDFFNDFFINDDNNRDNDNLINPKISKNDKIDDVSEKKINMIEILNKIKNGNVEVYNNLGIDEYERSSNFSEIAYVLVHWMSCIGIKRVDWEEAKRQNRKKGDGKGQWPSVVEDSNNTMLNLILINDFLNKNLWDLLSSDKNKELNNSKLVYEILKTLNKLIHPEEKEEYIWINTIKNKKNSDNDEITNFFLKLKPNLSDIEIDILKRKYSNKECFEGLKKMIGMNEKNE